jgi:hypothetical protein
MGSREYVKDLLISAIRSANGFLLRKRVKNEEVKKNLTIDIRIEVIHKIKCIYINK